MNERLRTIDFPTVLYPGVTMTVHVGDPGVPGLDLLSAGDLFVMRPEGQALLGCLCRLDSIQTLASGHNYKFIGLQRVFFENEGPWAVNVRFRPDRNEDDPETIELYRQLGELSAPLPGMPKDLRNLHMRVRPGMWIDLLGFNLPVSLPARVWMLAQTDVLQRARSLVKALEGYRPPQPARARVYAN